MIDYTDVEVGDVLKIVGVGAPGYGELGDLVRVIKVETNGVKVEDKRGVPCDFVFNCGAARLEKTEWTKDFDIVLGMHILEEPEKEDFGERIKRLRIANNYSREVFAKVLKVSVERVEKLESGYILPAEPRIKELAKLLRISEHLLKWFAYRKKREDVDFPEAFDKVNGSMESIFETFTRAIAKESSGKEKTAE